MVTLIYCRILVVIRHTLKYLLHSKNMDVNLTHSIYVILIMLLILILTLILRSTDVDLESLIGVSTLSSYRFKTPTVLNPSHSTETNINLVRIRYCTDIVWC